MSHSKILASKTKFFYHTFRNILFISLPILTISALVLSLPHSSAASGTDSLTITISSACTLSSKVDSEHNVSVNAGTYTADIGRTTITTLCNDGNGYSIYAIGYGNNEEGNNRLINSSYPQYSIDTGLATSGLTSQWAMRLDNIVDDPSPTPPVIEPDYSNTYGIIPPYWTKVAGRDSGTTDMAEGSSFTTTYAVYAASSQYVGTYEGKVKYLLTHPASPSAFHYMQDVAKWQNEIPNPGDTLLATDARDNKNYYVTRLADGHIWMTQNLDFDIDANTTLNSQTTDLNVTYDASTGEYSEYNDSYAKSGNVIYWTPANTATTIDFTGTTVAGWQNSNTTPYTASKTDDTNTGHSSLGNYYNWTAAIASNDSSNLTANTYNNISQNPKNSICPKGWRLPTISNESETTPDSTNEFARLNYLYGEFLNKPLDFTLAGYINNTSLSSYNTGGAYWSSTIISSEGVYTMELITSSVTPEQQDRKYYGDLIRCVAR